MGHTKWLMSLAMLSCLSFDVISGQLATTASPAVQCSQEADIVFILDSSGSVGSLNFLLLLDFTATFTGDFQVGPVRFGLITYSSSAQTIFNLNTYSDNQQVRKAILSTNYTSGGTNTAEALALARTSAFTSANGARAGVPKIAIVLTDGQSGNTALTAMEANNLKDSNVLVLAVGIADAFMPELEIISTYPEDVYLVPNYDVLVSIVRQYSRMTCDVAILFNCNSEVDIFFLLDSSSSVLTGSYGYSDELQFTASLSARFNLGDTAIGAATFGSDVARIIALQEVTDQQQLTQSLLAAPSVGGQVDTAKALQWIIQEDVFSAANGGRDQAAKVLVVLTDGRSPTSSQAATYANILSATGVKILAVGLTAATPISELQDIASDSASVFQTTSNNIYDRIQQLTTGRPCSLPSHSVKNVTDICRALNWVNGQHPHPYDCTKFIDCTFLHTDIMQCDPDLIYDANIEVCNYPSATNQCNGFNGGDFTVSVVTPVAPTGKPCVAGEIDVLFLVDTSVGVTQQEYGGFLQFAANLAENFQIGPNQVQFATTTFSTTVQNIFDFSAYSDYRSLQAAILNAPYKPSTIHIHVALQDARENTFTSVHGARTGASKVVILMSNGGTTDLAETQSQATLLKNDGALILAVGSPSANKQELGTIASNPFQVFDTNDFNGVLHAIQGYMNTSCKAQRFVCRGLQMADIIFVLDSSASILPEHYQELLTFVADFTNNFNISVNDARFAVVIFSQSAQKLFDLMDYQDHASLETAIMHAPFLASGTETAAGLNLVSDQAMFSAGAGGRNNATKIVIVMTDGRSNNMNDTLTAANRLKNIGVQFISVGIGYQVNVDELKELASDSTTYFQVPGYDVLDLIRDELTQKACSVRPCFPGQLDVLFLIDTSVGVTQQEYVSFLHFATNLAENFQMGPNHVQFATTTFSTTVQHIFDFNTYSDYRSLQEAILNAPYKPSSIHTYVALQDARENTFTSAHGARPGASRVVILMSNGGTTNFAPETQYQANLLKNDGALILAVGTPNANKQELETIASTAYPVFDTNDFNGVLHAIQGYMNTSCKGAHNSVTVSTPVITSLCETYFWVDGFHPNPYDCTTYIECNSFQTTVRNCPSGQLYDPSVVTCVNPSQVVVSCDDPNYFGVSVHVPHSSLVWNPVTPFPIDVSDICAIFYLPDGIYPDPSSCYHFVECVGHTTYHMECPDGLEFNTRNNVCDDVHVVDCNVNFNFFANWT